MIKYTIGLLAHGHKLAKPTMVKAFMQGDETSGVTITIERAETLATIRALGDRWVSWDSYQDRPRDDVDEAEWAFSMFGLRT